MIYLEPKMLALIKSFKMSAQGKKRGGLSLLKKKSRKRKRAEFTAGHPLATTISDSIGEA